MTECVDVAYGYSQNKRDKFFNSPRSTIFVNEVLESEKLKIIKFKTILGIRDTYEDLHQFHKHHHVKSPQPTDKDYTKDSLGRRYRNLPIDGSNLFDEYVARDSVTIPRYLIVLQPHIEETKNYIFSLFFLILFITIALWCVLS